MVRGEVFVTSVEYGTTKQITHTPEAEEGVSFGADNRTLVYASERDGISGLYTAKIVRKEEKNFPNATLIEEEEFPQCHADRRRSPASLENRRAELSEILSRWERNRLHRRAYPPHGAEPEEQEGAPGDRWVYVVLAFGRL